MKNVRLFDGLDSQETNQLLQCLGSVRRKYVAGEVILSYSTSLHHLCAVMRGTVEIICMDADGLTNNSEMLKAGDVFGELFALPMGSVAYSVFAKSDCEILFMEHERIVNRCARKCAAHDQLIRNLFFLSALRSQMLSRRISILSQKTLRQKLLLYLEYMTMDSGSKRFDLPIPLSQLAVYLAADRCAMMREIGRMRSEGLIRQTGRSFELLSV